MAVRGEWLDHGCTRMLAAKHRDEVIVTTVIALVCCTG